MVCSRELVAKSLLPDRLSNCPMCGRWFCNRCAVWRGGRDFCGARCGDTYFFAGEEGESEIAEE